MSEATETHAGTRRECGKITEVFELYGSWFCKQHFEENKAMFSDEPDPLNRAAAIKQARMFLESNANPVHGALSESLTAIEAIAGHYGCKPSAGKDEAADTKALSGFDPSTGKAGSFTVVGFMMAKRVLDALYLAYETLEHFRPSLPVEQIPALNRACAAIREVTVFDDVHPERASEDEAKAASIIRQPDWPYSNELRLGQPLPIPAGKPRPGDFWRMAESRVKENGGETLEQCCMRAIAGSVHAVHVEKERFPASVTRDALVNAAVCCARRTKTSRTECSNVRD